jgi:predicted dehydrogenase
MVCYNYRYMETVAELKGRIDKGEFGDLTFISICGHGYTFHHSIDLLRYLCGEITSVSAKYIIDGKPFLYPLGDWVYTAPYAQAAYPDLIGDMDHIIDEGSMFNKTFPVVLKAFADALIHDVDPPITGRDGIRALEIEDAIVKSNDYGSSVVPYLNIKE